MAKTIFPLILFVSSVSLAAGCSAEPSNGAPGGTGNPTAGNTGNPTAGSTGNPTAGSSGLAGASSMAGSSGGGTPGAGGSTGNAGGNSMAGTATGGTGVVVNPGDGPAGYWTEKDWHGCAWTGKGELGATTVTPMDFMSKPPADPFCISGSVGAEPMYQSVALLGFNVNEAPPASCAYKAADPNGEGPPSVVPTEAGLAVNFVKRGADTSFTLRVQIQGPNGHKPGTVGAADRWCATLTEVQGKMFVPWGDFTPSCWETMPAMRGTPYAKQPLSAVVFSVPGKLTATPYDFCVKGFTYGATADEAPEGPAVPVGDQTGIVGTNVSPAGDFSRAKVNVGGKNYIIQNNNWGNPSGTDLILSYKNNSFVVTSGSGTGASAPASFPSIYIGNNGNTANGVYSTKPGDNLPIRIADIASIPSTFRYSGTTSVWNAAYDIWFANEPPTVAYDDGINGFVMIWLRDPPNKSPIHEGGDLPQATIAGKSWKVFKGPRGDGPAGYNSAPVISFVNNGPEGNDDLAQWFKDIDVNLFIAKAVSDYGFPASLYLTDVFAGFEIWEGGAGGNLSVDEFTAVVNKK